MEKFEYNPITRVLSGYPALTDAGELPSGAEGISDGTLLAFDETSDRYVPVDPGAADGTQHADAILCGDVNPDATNPRRCTVYVCGHFNQAWVKYPTGTTSATYKRALRLKNIYLGKVEEA